MTVEELERIAAAERQNEGKFNHHIYVCIAAGCLSSNADAVRDALRREVLESGMQNSCQVKGVGCMGLCSAGPLVSVEPDSMLYAGVTPEDAPEIVSALGTPNGSQGTGRCATDIPFFARQQKIVLENSGKIDPERIEDYIAAEGYKALVTALTEMTPREVIDEVLKSGLRGRGGAGYPTGLKWSTVAKAGEERKYVICNADEGDPGAFMDRAVLESDPHRVLEGMAIAAYAVGAQHGYIYVRAEYPLAVKNLKTAIRQAERMGLLGNNICGTTFSFRVEIRLGAGAFVCGEETALIASIEGKRGTPRPRPPYPAEEGLWGCPTLINNVETFANIAPIIRNGGDWFAGIGTEKSKGTKVFALAGRVANTGLIEVPMGITLREIIFEIGGGIPDGKKFKAVQTGGPSGGCIPEQHLDVAGGLRIAGQDRLHHGLGRHDRHGRDLLHGGRGEVLHGVLQKRIVRQVRAVPRGHRADARPAEAHHGRRGDRRRPGAARGAVRPGAQHQPVRAGPDGAQPGGQHAALFPRRVRGAHRGQGLRGGRMQAADEGGESVTPKKTAVRVKTLTIDGREVGAREDQTILEVAREQKIYIPTLCWLPGLSNVGACRLCLVEVKGVNRLLPACVTRVEEGMEVTVNSERLARYRRQILELLFAERNHVCSVCVSNGHCDLQALALTLGMTHVHYPYQYPKLPVDASHERFVVDHNRCILCTRCVRVCDEIEGAHTWDVMARGMDCRVITDLSQPWGESESCTGCGKCVQVCPTGALSEKGRSVAEMSKRRQFLPYLTLMREGRR